MRVSLLTGLLVTLLLLHVTKADISFDYSAEIVLRNALVNTTFNITSEFANSITSALQSAASSPAPLSSWAYAAPPDVLISTSMWSSGSNADVETSVAAINATFAQWASGNNAAVTGALSSVCITSVGQQPSTIDFNNGCSFWGETLPPPSGAACWRNLSVAFYTGSSIRNDVRDALRTSLCSFLPTDCGLVSYGGMSTAQIISSGATVTVNVMPFTVISRSREDTLAALVAYAQYASLLLEYNVMYILVDGVQVFFQGNTPQFITVGTSNQCVGQMWYLIFLIILFPLILIISHRLYYWGRRSGKRSIKEAERDIRAGVRLGAVSWGAFGVGGYQGGPQQGYEGNNNGDSGLPQRAAIAYLPSGNPQQFYTQAPSMAGQGWSALQQGVGQQYGN